MEIKNKILFGLLGLLLLVIAMEVGLLLFKDKDVLEKFEDTKIARKIRDEDLEDDKIIKKITDDDFVNKIKSNDNNPIEKHINPYKKEVVYEIKGNMVGKLEKQKSNLLKGKMVIKNDPLKREWELLTGYSGSGGAYLGIYEGGFDNRSVWKKEPTEKVIEMIKDGEEIIISVKLSYEGEGRTKSIFKGKEQFWDGLINEFNENEFKIKPRKGMVIYASQLGVIR